MGLLEAMEEFSPAQIVVVDDGSTDGTAAIAADLGVTVIRLERNGGKGAALRAGMARALAMGFTVALTVDADLQHPPRSAREVLHASPDADALVLGVRHLARDGAPKANRFSNGFSNRVLSFFAGRRLGDTQCGLRRYPIEKVLALGGWAAGYAYEAEILLLAVAAGMALIEKNIFVYYPPKEERQTHFHVVRDPARIVVVVARTLVRTALRRRLPRVALALMAVVAILVGARSVVLATTAIVPPPVPLPRSDVNALTEEPVHGLGASSGVAPGATIDQTLRRAGPGLRAPS